MRVRGLAFWASALASVAYPTIAKAQSTQFLYEDSYLEPLSIPEGFDRGRNVSVVDKPRPDYDPLGLPVGSFTAHPSLDVGVGGTNNVFLNNDNKHDSSLVTIDPSLRVASDWSRNSLILNSGADVQRYFDAPSRNLVNWNVGAKGRLDATDNLSISTEADVTRQYENPYIGNTSASTSVFSNYLANFVQVRGEYKAGRVRLQLSLDTTGAIFAPLDTGSGVTISQRARDERDKRVTAQAEYASSPSVSFFVRGTYYRMNYLHPLAPGVPNRDSNGERVVFGTNIDISALMRGTIAVGFVTRDFDAARYRRITGPSVETKLEFFPSELTTITLSGQRYLEESSFGDNNPDFANRVGLRVDHELLNNLIVDIDGVFSRIQYIGLSEDRNYYRMVAGARYVMTRNYGMRANLSYGHETGSDPDRSVIQQNFTEVAGQLGFYLQL